LVNKWRRCYSFFWEGGRHYLDNEMEKTGISDYSKIPEYPKLEAMYNEMEQTRLYLAEIGLSHLTPEQYEQKVMEIKNNK
jgi:hypothetical protein